MAKNVNIETIQFKLQDFGKLKAVDKTLKEFSEDIDFVAGVLEAFKKFYANAQSGN